MKRCATVTVLTVANGARIEYDAAHPPWALVSSGDKVKLFFFLPDDIEKPKVVKT